jgi:energy-coupling factor transporter ATP-binding protein EcfA2
MIKSLKVQNFRCYKMLDLPDLQRINIVVGKNATGKTALLEAVRIALGGTPGVLWALNQSRAVLLSLQQPISREQWESIWNPYFFNFDSSKEISAECTNSEGRQATVKIYYDPQKSVTSVPPQQQAPTSAVATITPLAFERTDFSGIHSKLYASVQPQGALSFDPGPELGVVIEYSGSVIASNPQQTAQWFSQLRVQQRDKDIVDAVREEFNPLIENLDVLAPGPFPAIYATIRNVREKLPLSLVSAGINKFVAMLAALLSRRDAVVLIDEIENGLYYKTLESLWKTILKLSKQNNTQVFASTHSLECVRALLPTLKGNEDEVSLLRVERENGSSVVTCVKGKMLEAAIDEGFEVR